MFTKNEESCARCANLKCRGLIAQSANHFKSQRRGLIFITIILSALSCTFYLWQKIAGEACAFAILSFFFVFAILFKMDIDEEKEKKNRIKRVNCFVVDPSKKKYKKIK